MSESFGMGYSYRQARIDIRGLSLGTTDDWKIDIKNKMNKYEEIKERYERLAWMKSDTPEANEFHKTCYKDEWYWSSEGFACFEHLALEDLPLLLKALELCHEEWREAYQSLCYEGGYSTLAEKTEALTPDYWLEKASKEME